MTVATHHRLDGLEPDNFLAFLALLGLLNALETHARAAGQSPPRPRVFWDLDHPPLRPVLVLSSPASPDDIAGIAWAGMQPVWTAADFRGRDKLKFTVAECRELFAASVSAGTAGRCRADLWTALLSDVSDDESAVRTPLCLLDVAQTSFLKNFASVTDVPRVRGKKAADSSMIRALVRALFSPWTRDSATPSFRWDPVEDSRHAHRWSAPTSDKQGVEHGANVLATMALPLLPVIAQPRYAKRAFVPGGLWQRGAGFSFAWPIWRHPATLSGIRGLLTHAELRHPGALAHLGVDHVLVASRIPVGKYANFTRARLVGAGSVPRTG
jgi:hypothetical protein